MKLISYKCPNCNSLLQIDISKRTFFCTYCGSQLNIDLGDNSFTYIEIDEAKIRQAEANEKIEISKMEYKLKEMEIKNKKDKDDMIIWAIILIFSLFGMLFMLNHYS